MNGRTAATLALVGCLVAPATVCAAEARLIRADARSSDRDQTPILTTLIDVGEVGPSGFEPRELPADATLVIESAARPAELVDRTLWSTHTEPGFGTAWLVVLDADPRMGSGLGRAKEIALALVASLRPNDALDLVVLDDRRVVSDSGWRDASAREQLSSAIRAATPGGAQRNRGLVTLLEGATKTAFGALPGTKLRSGTPLHQALVVLSTGYGGADPKSTGPGGAELSRALEQGRFPADNTSAPKMPIPIVSVAFPTDVLPEHRHNAAELMRALHSPRIGGAHHAIETWDEHRAQAIVGQVRKRFDAMHVVRWRLPCLAPTPTQSLRLEFPRAPAPMIGDATFRDVPLGAPLRFPLAIDFERTRSEVAQAGGLAPGDTLRVYGRFCWGDQRARARAYFLPRGTLVPDTLDDADPNRIEQSRADLVRAGLSSAAKRSDASFVEVVIPSDSRLVGSELRVVLEDEVGPRTSGLTARRIITVKSRRGWPRWLPWTLGALVLAALGGGGWALRRR